MPLNQRTLKARSNPERTVSIDHRWRIPLPPEIDWAVGMRVYFSLKQAAAPSIVISRRPAGLYRGRMHSGRIRRIPLVRRGRMRRTSSRRPPRRSPWSRS